MFEIKKKNYLNDTVIEMEIYAPSVVRHACPGQFIILRVTEDGERIPLTIAGANTNSGCIRIIFQKVGATTDSLAEKEVGDTLADFVGPLGKPTDLEGKKRVCVIGGGVGSAIAYPIAQALHDKGVNVTTILGFRTKGLCILEEDFKAVSDQFHLMTDDGSYGEAGNVTIPLKALLESGETFDEIITIGPLIMMKFVVKTAEPFKVPVTVSMNPIMIDGTGMCGGCRLSVLENGERKMKFACVDGPDFDGYSIDFDEAMKRNRMFLNEEKRMREENCNLLKKDGGC